jgi:hypothetical protein
MQHFVKYFLSFFYTSVSDTGEEGVLNALWQRYDHTVDKVLTNSIY